MFGFGKAKQHKEIGPRELQIMREAGAVLIVDVREPDEFASGHIEGALNYPLSSFDPAKVPCAPGKTTVLQCAGGKRSGMALDKCATAQEVIDTHLAGGIGAWIAAGYPVVRG